tara:strand:- start:5383 stop:5691 length:309 start_codon:yes stop_codon:yes gene_type:complete
MEVFSNILSIFKPFVDLYLFSDKYILYLLFEAVVVGLITMGVGYGISFAFRRDITDDCKKCANESNGKMLAALFLTGLIIHLLCEMSGVNRWYLKNGAAAMP